MYRGYGKLLACKNRDRKEQQSNKDFFHRAGFPNCSRLLIAAVNHEYGEVVFAIGALLVEVGFQVAAEQRQGDAGGTLHFFFS